jgi:hypothetical protein
MSPIDFLNHIFNLLAPALWLALLLPFLARLFLRQVTAVPALRVQIAVNFAVTAATLLLGLWFFGHDGRVATYAGMALLCASSQWLLSRR